MLAKNTHDKYRKYRKNNKCNKIPNLERKEAERFQLAKKYPCYFLRFLRTFRGSSWLLLFPSLDSC